MTNLLSVRNLCVNLNTNQGVVTVGNHIDLDLRANEILGLIGESGCGKTLTTLALTGLLPPGSQICWSSYQIDRHDISALDQQALAALRGRSIGYIFQDPSTCLNPLLTIGRQIQEVVLTHEGCSLNEAKGKALLALELVGLTPAQTYFHAFAHQLSGGMNQRAMIAIAVVHHPTILIADEPTTALDVLKEKEIIQLIRRFVRQGSFSCLWITHDVALLHHTADRLAVMYAGRVVEEGRTGEVFNHPQHPYTQGLFKCLPQNLTKQSFSPIPGEVPLLGSLPSGCKFHPRCSWKKDICEQKEPEFISCSPTQRAKCWLLSTN